MKFRTFNDYGSKNPNPSGSRYRNKYTKLLEADGKQQLVKVGTEDVYDSIQKAGQGMLLEDLIRRARSGDSTAIPSPVDSYVDISAMPKDLLEAHSMLKDAKDKYLRLPAELRAKFGNSFDDFLKASVDGSLVSTLSQVNKTDTVAQLTPDELTKIRNVIGGNSNA